MQLLEDKGVGGEFAADPVPLGRIYSVLQKSTAA